MSSEKNPDVLVVGAGPVGLFAALELNRRGVRARIVDTGIWSCKHSYALALHPQSVRLMRESGLAEGELQRGYAVREIGLYDGQRRRAGLTMDEPLMVLRQDAIEDSLERALKERGIKVEWRHEASQFAPDAEFVKVKIDKFEKESRGYAVAHGEWMVAESREVEAAYVVGADGYGSRVRRTLNVDFPEVGRAQYYAVFEFHTSADLGGEMRLVLGDGTTDVLWPLPGGFARWSFELPDYRDEEAERLKDGLLTAGLGYFPTERPKDREMSAPWGHLPVLEESHLKTLLAERAPWFEGKVEHVTWRTVVRFEKRSAARYGQGRMWLAGDAAHLTGPAGVQSMNLGFFEARDLAEALSGALKGQSGRAALEAYDARWVAIWRQMQGLGESVKTGAGADPWVAAHWKDLLPCLPAHGPALATLAAQLRLEMV